ncbi:hypothetical protein EYY86_14580 [Hafnia paralvei]|uniref:hypothetical protein n=1 Tax=Hafnia paralvei TaxID=546367 RepID=UPI0010345614|nr:hypothetical protein [Hafnia paralvei]TBM13504.1 hypothetical protein EYY86_14580 [Hafnia paralvei]
MKLSELSAKTLVKQAHAGVKLVSGQYPEAAAILREVTTRYDVLYEVRQQDKDTAIKPEPVDLSQQVELLNRILSWIPTPTPKATAMAVRLSSIIDVISNLGLPSQTQPATFGCSNSAQGKIND